MFPSRLRATPYSDGAYILFRRNRRLVSIPHSGHPSFRPRRVDFDYRVNSFPSRIRATPHSDWAIGQACRGLKNGFHPAFGPPLIQTEKPKEENYAEAKGFHPAFGPPLIQTSKTADLAAGQYQFPSRIRATPHSDTKRYGAELLHHCVSIPHSGHPSFRRKSCKQ